MRTLPVIGLLLLLAASQAVAQVEPRPTDQLVRDLKSPDTRTRRLAAEALGKRKVESAIAPLATLLKDPERGVRNAAQDALVRLGPKAVPALTRALSDESESTRLAAVSALSRLAEPPSGAVKELTGALKDKNVDVRARAAFTLGKIGAPARSALPALFEAAKDTRSEPRSSAWPLPRSLTEAAIEAALKIDPECGVSLAKEILPGLLTDLRGKDSELISAAANALARLGPHAKPALPALEEIQQKTITFGKKRSPDEEISARLDAQNAIIAIGGDPTLPYVKTACDRTAKSQDRCRAIFEIGLIGHPSEKAIPALVELLKDPDASVRAYSVRLITEIGPAAKAAIPALEELLGDQELEIAAGKHGMPGWEMVPRALARMGLDAVPDLIAVLKNGRNKWIDRLQATKALGRVGGPAAAALPILEEALGDKELAIAVEAAAAYIRIGGDREKALPVLRAGLRSQSGLSVWLATLAAERLGIRAKSLASDLIPLLIDKDRGTRLVAVEALCKMGRAAKPAVWAIAKLLASEDRYERDRIMEALTRLGPDALDAVPALIGRLQDSAPYAFAQNRAVAVLESIGPDARAAVPALVEMLKGKDQGLVRQVMQTLGRIGPGAKSAVPQLMLFLDPKKRDDYLLAGAAQALGGIGPDAKEAVPQLKELCEDEDKVVRVWAAYALARITGDSQRQVTFLIELFEDDREYPTQLRFNSVQSNVLQALELIGRDARPARDFLLKVLADARTKKWIRIHAARVLGHLGDDAELIVPSLTSLIEQAARSPDRTDLCKGAAEALLVLGPKARSAVPHLRPLLADVDDGVADSAARALDRIESRRD